MHPKSPMLIYWDLVFGFYYCSWTIIWATHSHVGFNRLAVFTSSNYVSFSHFASLLSKLLSFLLEIRVGGSFEDIGMFVCSVFHSRQMSVKISMKSQLRLSRLRLRCMFYMPGLYFYHIIAFVNYRQSRQSWRWLHNRPFIYFLFDFFFRPEIRVIPFRRCWFFLHRWQVRCHRKHLLSLLNSLKFIYLFFAVRIEVNIWHILSQFAHHSLQPLPVEVISTDFADVGGSKATEMLATGGPF